MMDFVVTVIKVQVPQQKESYIVLCMRSMCVCLLTPLKSEVSEVTGYGMKNRVSIPGRDIIFLFATTPRPARRFTQPERTKPYYSYQNEADHSSPSGAEVKNTWSFTSASNTVIRLRMDETASRYGGD
jgi:hypothetical protein